MREKKKQEKRNLLNFSWHEEEVVGKIETRTVIGILAWKIVERIYNCFALSFTFPRIIFTISFVKVIGQTFHWPLTKYHAQCSSPGLEKKLHYLFPRKEIVRTRV